MYSILQHHLEETVSQLIVEGLGNESGEKELIFKVDGGENEAKN